MNWYRIFLTSPGGGPDPIQITRHGVAGVMSEVRRAKAWGYSLVGLELA